MFAEFSARAASDRLDSLEPAIEIRRGNSVAMCDAGVGSRESCGLVIGITAQFETTPIPGTLELVWH